MLTHGALRHPRCSWAGSIMSSASRLDKLSSFGCRTALPLVILTFKHVFWNILLGLYRRLAAADPPVQELCGASCALLDAFPHVWGDRVLETYGGCCVQGWEGFGFKLTRLNFSFTVRPPEQTCWERIAPCSIRCCDARSDQQFYLFFRVTWFRSIIFEPDFFLFFALWLISGQQHRALKPVIFLANKRLIFELICMENVL